MVRFISFLLLLSCQPISAQDSWKNVYSESAWAERDRWQKADELIRYLAIQRGSQVADVGCHEGYMTVKLASEVGPQGKVYAVDVEQSKLDRLETILAKRSLHQVDAIKGDSDNPKLPLNSLDGVIILDAYHEMDSHDEILQHVKVALKPGGRLILCEAVAESRRNSTREEQERKHELGMNFALEDLHKAGFTIVLKKDPFVDRSKEKGDMMWLIVAKKQ